MKTTNHTVMVNKMKMALIGFVLVIIGYIFCSIETNYFGSNYFPESKQELLCDFISVLLCGAGGSIFVYALVLHTLAKIRKIKTYEPETKLRERALNNEINCNAGAMQILYTLVEADLLKEPYRGWAAGSKPTEGEELVKYNKAITDLEQSLILYNDQIKVEGGIIG